MNTKKSIIYIIMIIAFTAIAVILSFFLYNIKHEPTSVKDDFSDNAVSIFSDIQTSSELSSYPSSNSVPHYLLKNENDVLKLYEIFGESKQLIKSININSVFLPPDDREQLKNGIEFTDKEYGYKLIEDYTS